MFSLPSLQYVIYLLPGFIIGLTCHEYAHGRMAYILGDETARYNGRLTLNPAAHLDPIGLLMLFFAGFGWAKPVPVNPYNLQVNIKQGMLLVALAGPATNLIIALAATLLLGVFGGLGFVVLNSILQLTIHINIVLAIFNLIPIPPLDGSRILAGLLPGENAWLDNLEQYGFIILIILVFTGALRFIFDYLISPVESSFWGLANAINAMLRLW